MPKHVTCSLCYTEGHTFEEHKVQVKKDWYIKNNYRDRNRIARRQERGSVRVFNSKNDKELGRDFNETIKKFCECVVDENNYSYWT